MESKICDCFEKGHSNDYCKGTREKDWCSCGGDEAKCDFYEHVRERKKRKIQEAINITIEIPKIQADCLLDFLECEFINGIGGKEDMQNNGYVKNIRAVYDKLQEVCQNA